MDCPVCKNAMVTFQLEEVEVDHCLECRGIWLDAGELEELLGESEHAEEMLDSFAEAKNCTERLRKCPICFKKMRKIMAGPGREAKLIDKCKKGHGLWFDKGELTDIMATASFDKADKVRKLLTDMFEVD